MAFSSRLSAHTKSSLAKSKAVGGSPSSPSSSPTRHKEQKQQKVRGSKSLGGDNGINQENGASKLPHGRKDARKNSNFVNSLEEKTLEARDMKNSDLEKFPAKTKFQASEISPKSKASLETLPPKDDFTLSEAVNKMDEVLFMQSPEYEPRKTGVLSRSQDSSLSALVSKVDNVMIGRPAVVSMSIDLEELRNSHSWCNDDFPQSPKLAFMGETSPVSVLDFRQELLEEQPLTPASCDESNEFKGHGSEKEGQDLDDSTVPGYFVGISADLAADIGGNEQDLEYVQHVLQISGFGGSRLPPWFSQTIPVNPSVFEHLELEIAVGTTFGIESFEKVNNSDRHQRKLLFDAVNEALAQSLRPFLELPAWEDKKELPARPRPIGCDLLEEVWMTIQSWPIPGSEDLFEVLDEVARRDMVTGTDTWRETGKEEAEVVFAIERMLLDELLEDLIDELGVAELNQICDSEESDNEFPVILMG